MKNRRRPKLALILALVIAVLSLAGCPSDGGSEAEPVDDAAGDATDDAEEAMDEEEATDSQLSVSLEETDVENPHDAGFVDAGVAELEQFAQTLGCAPPIGATDCTKCEPTTGATEATDCIKFSVWYDNPCPGTVGVDKPLPIVVTDSYLVSDGDLETARNTVEAEGIDFDDYVLLQQPPQKFGSSNVITLIPKPEPEPDAEGEGEGEGEGGLTPEDWDFVDDALNEAGRFPNITYFLNPGKFNFRPDGTPPVPFESGDDAFRIDAVPPPSGSLVSTPAQVWVLDTGSVPADVRLPGISVKTGTPGGNIDNDDNDDNDDIVDDLYRGHGPLIADMIGDMIEMTLPAQKSDDPDRGKAQLLRVLTENSVPGGDIVNPDRTSRSFDTTALLSTLDQIDGGTGVLNLSLSAQGCEELYPPEHPLVEWFINNPNITVVAAAGNDGSDIPNFPAALSEYSQDNDLASRVISVGAMSPDGFYTCFTNYHESVDVYAVGQDIFFEHPTEGDVTWRGTSFAAPQVAAYVALGWDKDDLRNTFPAEPTDIDCPPPPPQ